MNQIFTIRPYQWNGIWVFDDPARGLIREALVAGVPELIQKATQLAGIINPEFGFLVLFSNAPFPGGNIQLKWVRTETFGGNTYVWEGQEGWLCPALFKYFDEAPETIYLQVRPAPADETDFENWYAARVRDLGTLLASVKDMSPESLETMVRPWLRSLAFDAWQQGRKSAMADGTKGFNERP
jgi:hypothetical protein